jgi:putative photosynthetic complex assembly protein 2
MHNAAAIAFVVLLWWGSTGLILYLNGLPRRTHPLQMVVVSLLLLPALALVGWSARGTEVSHAYLAFSAALGVWGWQEVAFLLGYVTGPRRTPCPGSARGWDRVRLAVLAILYHEAALLVLGAAVFLLCTGQPNQVAWWTFLALWTMRLSAKLNLFFGVRNLNDHFLPDHLRYLGSYFRRRNHNRWFPFSLLAASAATGLAWWAAAGHAAGSFEAIALALVGALLALALLEHVFMVLPAPSDRLWRWALPASRRGD